MTKRDEDLYLKIAKIYIDGSACDGCKHEQSATCCERYKECAKRIKQLLQEDYE